MRIGLYVQDGLEQIVLTPESPIETNLLEQLHKGGRDLSIVKGQFFECMGGLCPQQRRQPRHHPRDAVPAACHR